MNRIAFLVLAPSALIASCASTGMDGPAQPDTAAIAAAVAAGDRPEAARMLDESRKPAETLALLGLRSGMDVADVISGTGYWADIMAEVVGPSGSVTALEPEQFYNDEAGVEIWADLAARNPNLSLVRYPFERLVLPADRFDAAILNLSYHDLYWESEQYKIPRSDPEVFVGALYQAMRPGGRILVIDHVGPAGDTRTIVDKLHRIDPAVVRADFERAGFELAGQSTFLANPADDHTKLVFDPSIRGKTDRFAMVFRKPA